MNCMSCGATLTSTTIEYCPHCGSNVQVQRKVEYLSRLYYNRGLEKAEIRDLSGAISQLKVSLMFNKNNIQARNLLGLVYFETGEVVEALSQWVISKNLHPSRKNLATEYIAKLQANPGKLEDINDTIRKYNTALDLCRQGHSDMAAIQLKKVLAQNPKLIKGYHLLALIQMKQQSYAKARNILRKAAKIDKTNTTTLRFLKEIEEQTGVVTKIDVPSRGGKKAEKEKGRIKFLEKRGDFVIQPPTYRQHSALVGVVSLLVGAGISAAMLWYLLVPSIRQGIYQEANEQIMNYSDYLVWQEAELSSVKGELQVQDTSQDTAQYVAQISALQSKNNSYQALLRAYSALKDDQPAQAAEFIQLVKPSTLSETALAIYNTICSETGQAGSESLYTDTVVEDISDSIDENTENDSTAGMYTDTTGYYDANAYYDQSAYYGTYDTTTDWGAW